MRTVLAVTVLVIAAFVGPAVGQGAAESERPFAGVLPLPDELVSVNPPERGVNPPRRRAAWLLDADTQSPVPGAVLWCARETEDEHVMDYGDRLASAQADADGLAVLDVGDGEDGYHWIAAAPGYAPTHVSPTYRPEPLMLLRRGAPAAVRVLDGLGRPVAGAFLDLYPGCLHGPSVVAGRTGSDGCIALGQFVPGTWWFDVRTATGARDQTGPEKTLGLRPWDVVLEPRWEVCGRLVDSAGKPIVGAAVRSDAWERAPRTLTDAGGGFRLAGCSPFASVVVTLSGQAEPIGYVRHFASKSCLVRLAAAGSGFDEPEANAHVTLHAFPEARVRVVRDDGWAMTLSADDASMPGTIESDVPEGDYVVEPATQFGAATFSPQRIAARPGLRVTCDLSKATPQPRLRLRGAVPEHAALVLAVEGEEIEKPDDVRPEDWRPCLPAEGAASLRVGPAGHYNVWFFFPVGAAANGERVVEVAVPQPHRFRILGGRPGQGDLTCEGVDVQTGEDGEWTTTYARGPMRLVFPGRWRIEGEEGVPDREFTFRLGDEPEKEPLVFDPMQAKPVALASNVRIRLALPEGVDRSAVRYVVQSTVATVSGKGPDDPIEATAPCRIVVSLAGYQSFDRMFISGADIEQRWGKSSLRLTVRDEAGRPTPAIVGVDGVRHWTSGGDLELAGLAAGGHDVVVSPVADTLEGRRLHIVLADGEHRQRAVVVQLRR